MRLDDLRVAGGTPPAVARTVYDETTRLSTSGTTATGKKIYYRAQAQAIQDDAAGLFESVTTDHR